MPAPASRFLAPALLSLFGASNAGQSVGFLALAFPFRSGLLGEVWSARLGFALLLNATLLRPLRGH